MKDYYSFACTSIGYSHIGSGKVCQDYSLYYQGDMFSVIVVSDGHGSSDFTRSDRGSKYACEVAVEAVTKSFREFSQDELENEFHRDDVVTQLCKYILMRWNSLIDEDVRNNPFTDEEVEKVSDKYKTRYLKGESVEHAYGCTLIIVVITKDFCLAIRNGDGQCVSVDRNGEFTTPIPWNDNCEFNVTTSLCDHDAINNFRYYYTANLPAGIFIGSDGVDDSYTSVEELYNLYRSVCMKALNEGEDSVTDYIEMLLPEITRRGSTDDVSIAGMIDISLLQEAKTAMELAQELRQKRMEEEQRERQKRILLRDIKVEEKKRSMANVQLEDVQQKLLGMQSYYANIMDRISRFRKETDACRDSMDSLMAEEKRLFAIINEVDDDITRLKMNLAALENADREMQADEPEKKMTVEMKKDTAELVNCVTEVQDEEKETVKSEVKEMDVERERGADNEVKGDGEDI